MLTHLGWKREWHWVHSSSGIPDTPGQKGEQGAKLERSGAGLDWWEDLAAGLPAVTGDCLEPGVTGRIETPDTNIKSDRSYFTSLLRQLT